MKYALVAAMALAAVPIASHAADPIKIAATFPLSGNAATFGQMARLGAELAVEEVNAKGGINGRPIQLDVQDNRCNPAEGVKLVTQLAADKTYVAMFDGFCSSVVLGSCRSLRANKSH